MARNKIDEVKEETAATETADTETADTETAATETADTETAATETAATETADTETAATETAATETADTETATSEGKTRIKPNTEKYVKGPNGQLHTDDVVGNGLAGLDLEHVKAVGRALKIDVDKYDHLNVGQRRMNIGNKIRGMLKPDKDKDGSALEQFNVAVAEQRLLIETAKKAAEEAKATEKAAA